MEKSLALVLPNRPGALGEVMSLFFENDLLVLRASYNHVIDVHTLFVDVSGTLDHIERAEQQLHARRLFPGERKLGQIRVLEIGPFEQMDVLLSLLVLVENYGLNITHFDLRTDGSGPNVAQAGIKVVGEGQFRGLMADLADICPVRIAESEDHGIADNTTFCLDFARKVGALMGLEDDKVEELLINSNRIVQNLMSNNSDPYKPFDYIWQTAQTIADYRGLNYANATRITRFSTQAGAEGVCVEPPVGSTTWVLACDDCLLCFDAGFRCYAEELEKVLHDAYPAWSKTRHVLALTHADVDHVGDTTRFEEVYASGRVIDSFMFESMGIVNWREQSPLGFPYNLIAKVLCDYEIPDYQSMRCLGEMSPFGEQKELFERIDTLNIAPFSFEVWEGKGGHIRGETVYLDRTHRICVSGDIVINVHGQTKSQARYNALAPFLMTSVDSDPSLAREEREVLRTILGPGRWLMLGGHGGLLTWEL